MEHDRNAGGPAHLGPSPGNINSDCLEFIFGGGQRSHTPWATSPCSRQRTLLLAASDPDDADIADTIHRGCLRCVLLSFLMHFDVKQLEGADLITD